MRASAQERFLERFQPEPNSGCWLWTAGMNGRYPNLWVEGKHVGAHRFSYEQTYGLVPEGLELDHLCNTPFCVNPQHLRAVTHKENVLRGKGSPAQNARKVYCLRGHVLEQENLYVDPAGSRRCRLCVRVANRDFMRGKRNRQRNTDAVS